VVCAFVRVCVCLFVPAPPALRCLSPSAGRSSKRASSFERATISLVRASKLAFTPSSYRFRGSSMSAAAAQSWTAHSLPPLFLTHTHIRTLARHCNCYNRAAPIHIIIQQCKMIQLDLRLQFSSARAAKTLAAVSLRVQRAIRLYGPQWH
jgi:hypothetical protein